MITEKDIEEVHDIALASEAEVESLLTRLLSQVTDNVEGCRQAIPLVHEAMVNAGLSVDLHHAAAGASESFPILIGWVGPRSVSPDVMLCAHLDTSPAGPGWNRNPLGENHSEYVFGRGAAVSKSDIAVYIHAAKAARHGLRKRPDISIAVAVTCDEGSGGDCGAGYLLGTMGLRPRMAICAGVSDVVTIAHNGCVQLKLQLTGTACHQSLVPSREDAMRHAALVCKSLYDYADELAQRSSAVPGLIHPTLNITRVAGGSAFGMSPREVEIWIDRRVLPDEQLADAYHDILIRIRATQAGTDVNTNIETVRLAEPMRPLEAARAFVHCLQNEAQIALGKNLKEQGSTLYTDARWFSASGIPTVMFGAGEADIKLSGANGSDERIAKRCLREGVVVLSRALTQYCLQTSGDKPWQR